MVVTYGPDKSALGMGMVECLTAVKFGVADYVKVIFGGRIWKSGSGSVARFKLFTLFCAV